ncbi:MAG: hypothetical protein FWF19_02160 [Euryarchaeota archaeon]|nr:hypothetical protein [Euryarchaeota archaeon]
MNRPGIVMIFLILLLISTGLVAAANFIMNQHYSFDRQGTLIEEYNQLLHENGVVGLNNLTYMVNSGLVLSFNRPIQSHGLVRPANHSYFLV